MKTFRLIAVSVVFAAIFAVSALAQTTAKIGLIDTRYFEDQKEGITKYVAAQTSLDNEFKPVGTELQTLATSIQALQKELQGYQDIVNKGGKVPIAEADIQKKLESLDKMQREYKFKEEDAKARYIRREAVVLGPIRQDIGNAIREYVKKNGYVLILDPSKDDKGLILSAEEATVDITKQFIAYYNARPATTAVVPK